MGNSCDVILFAESLHEKVWGGSALSAHFGKSVSSNVKIGESFEVFSGNIISGGRFDGRRLQTTLDEFPKEMTGHTLNGDYPLLVKLLDARDWLSVQVHPNDEQAAELEGLPRGKSECWYILEAEEDSQIVYGFLDGVEKKDIRNALTSGNLRDILRFLPVKTGDFISVPAGTVHAIGPGIVLYELQQTSDTTYRLYDWDRIGLDGAPRELHIDKGLICLNLTSDKTIRAQKQTDVGILFANPYFSLERLRITDSIQIQPELRERLITVIGGALNCKNTGEGNTLKLTKGQSAFIPACFSGANISSKNAEILIARRVDD